MEPLARIGCTKRVRGIAAFAALALATLGVLVAAVLALASETRSNATRVKAIEFCGPETCWAMPARRAGIDGSLFAAGHTTTRPAIPVRYYRVRFQYAPAGRGTALCSCPPRVFDTERADGRRPPLRAEHVRRLRRGWDGNGLASSESGACS